MSLKQLKDRKIFFYFFLGICLPCLLLSYLAYRGIQSYHALLLLQLQNEYRDKVEKIRISLDHHLSDTEKFYEDRFAAGVKFADLEKTNGAGIKSSGVLALFRMDKNGKINFSRQHFIYNHNNSLTPHLPGKLTLLESTGYWQGQRFEFKEKRFSRALKAYQNELASNKNPQIQTLLLFAIARVYNKLGLK